MIVTASTFLQCKTTADPAVETCSRQLRSANVLETPEKAYTMVRDISPDLRLGAQMARDG